MNSRASVNIKTLPAQTDSSTGLYNKITYNGKNITETHELCLYMYSPDASLNITTMPTSLQINVHTQTHAHHWMQCLRFRCHCSLIIILLLKTLPIVSHEYLVVLQVRHAQKQLLYHQPPPRRAAQLRPPWLSLSWSIVVNIIPLWLKIPPSPSYWRLSPASPLYPATSRRYLSLSSSPILNDQYSAEYQKFVVRFCTSTLNL